MCMDVFSGNDIRLNTCNSDNGQKFVFKSVNNINGYNIGLEYRFQVSKSNGFEANQTVDLAWQSSNKLQYPNGISTNTGYLTSPFSLENGKTYYVRVQAKDRMGNMASNKSNWQYYPPIIMDTTIPVVENFSLTNNAIIPIDKQNETQKAKNVPSKVNITADIYEDNFKKANIEIYQKSGLKGYTNGSEFTKVLDQNGSWYNQIYFNNRLIQTRVNGGLTQTRYSDDGSSWSYWQDIIGSNNTAGYGSFVPFNGKLYLFTIKQNPSNNLNDVSYFASTDGSSWQLVSHSVSGANVPGDEISAVVFDNQIHLMIRGGDNNVYYNASTGINNNTNNNNNIIFNWSGWRNYGGAGYNKFTNIVANNRLFSFLRGEDNRVYYRSSTDGYIWTGWNVNDSFKSITSIYSVPFGDKIIQAVISENGMGYYRSFDPKTNLATSWLPTQIWTNDPISLQIFENKLYLTIRNKDNGKLYQMSTTDGNSWTGFSILTATSSYQTTIPTETTLATTATTVLSNLFSLNGNSSEKLVKTINTCLEGSQKANCDFTAFNPNTNINNNPTTDSTNNNSTTSNNTSKLTKIGFQ